MRQPVPPYVKEIYRQVKDLFGGAKPIVDRYADDHEEHWVDVMRMPDCPQPGVTSYATLGMSRFDNAASSRAGSRCGSSCWPPASRSSRKSRRA